MGLEITQNSSPSGRCWMLGKKNFLVSSEFEVNSQRDKSDKKEDM